MKVLRIERVDDKLMDDVKIQAIKEGLTLREAVIKALEKWLVNKES